MDICLLHPQTSTVVCAFINADLESQKKVINIFFVVDALVVIALIPDVHTPHAGVIE